MSKNYSIYDSYGKPVKSGFPTWKAAFQYKICMQRYDWTIKYITYEKAV